MVKEILFMHDLNLNYRACLDWILFLEQKLKF